MKELILLFGIVSTILAFDSISLMQCKNSKACFKTSKSCNIDQCSYAISWKPVKYKDKAYLEIEMTGDVYRDGGYIAIGFSDDKMMGDDGVLACSGDSGNSKISIVAGYNNPLSKGNIIFSDSETNQNFIVKESGNKYGGSYNPNIKKISCRFLRLISPEINQDKLKDLRQGNSYYLLVARGEGMNLNSLKKHAAGTTVVSDMKIDFSSGSFNIVVGSSGLNSPLAKAHGIIMIIVWIFCCSIAIMLARYYKETWGKKMFSIKSRRFNGHRGLQGTGFILLVIAIILIFVHVGGYSKLEDYPMKAHPILGLICSILFIINPFIALCRCDPKNRNRPIFNWIHFIVGTVAYILSIPTIMIGLRLPGAGLVLSQMNSVQWIVFIFVIFQFCIEIILEIHSCMTYKKNKRKSNIYESELLEYEKAMNSGHKSLISPVYPRQSGQTFKRVILGIYITVVIVITLLLSILIIIN